MSGASGEKRKRIGDGNDYSPKKLKTQSSQKFKSDYSAKYSCIEKSEKDVFYARCTICSSDFNISHGGENDIKKHLSTNKHKLNKLKKNSITSSGKPCYQQQFTEDFLKKCHTCVINRSGMNNRKTVGTRPIRKCRIRGKIEQSQRIVKGFLFYDSEVSDPPKGKKTLDRENESIYKKWKVQMTQLNYHKENLRNHIFKMKFFLERRLLTEIQSEIREITLQTKVKQLVESVRQSVLDPQMRPPVQTHRNTYCSMPVSKKDRTTTEDFRGTLDTMKIKQEIDDDTCINECLEWRGACQGNKISHSETNNTVFIKKEIDFESPSNQRVDEHEKDDRSGDPHEIYNDNYNTAGTLQCSINDETKHEPFTKDMSENGWKIVKNPEWNNNLGDSKLKTGILGESNKENVLEYHYYPEDEDVEDGWKVVLNPEWEED